MPLRFRKVLIADERYETAGVFDVNNNGFLDIVRIPCSQSKPQVEFIFSLIMMGNPRKSINLFGNLIDKDRVHLCSHQGTVKTQFRRIKDSPYASDVAL